MATDEEYLDNLLMTVLENESKPKNLPEEVIVPEDIIVPEDKMTPEKDSVNEAVSEQEISWKEERKLITPDDLADMVDRLDEIMLMQEESELGEPAMPEGLELPEELVMPEGVELPEELAMPEGAELPEELVIPEGLELPEELAMPEEVELSEKLAMPEEAELPEELVMPEGVELPEELAMPEGAELPGELAMPEGVELPEELAMLEGVELPEELAMLEGLELPEESQSYKEADQPVDDIMALFENEESAEDDQESELHQADINDMDIGQLIDGMEADEELFEIKGLLDKAENNEFVEDDDMLALLDGVSEYGEKSEQEDNDDILALLNMEESEEASQADKRNDRKKSNKSKKGKKEKEEPEEFSLNEFDELEQKLKKKKSFLGKLFSALTDTDEEEPITEDGKMQNASEENQGILDELDQEDKKGKKGKKEKRSKGKKSKADEDEKPSKEKASKKKEPKQKEPKKKEPEAPMRPGKKVSKKNILLVFVFCMTFMAAIITVCKFLPDYQERAEARAAYFKDDFKTVYQLLYDKNLSNSDIILFNQASVVLQMERKEESYRNYKEMNMPVEAVNALLQGVKRYERLRGEDLYGAQDKVYIIYQNILSILTSEYNISEEEAFAILAYDRTAYTQKIHAIALGTEFAEPGGAEESGMPVEPQDILPEEEDIIQ